MKNSNAIKSEETIYSLKDYSGDKINSVEVVEKISPDYKNYVYIEKYQGNDGITFIGASAKLEEDKLGNTIPEEVTTGIWYYDNKFIEHVNNAKDFLPTVIKEYDPIQAICDFNIEVYQKRHIRPDFCIKAKASKDKRLESDDNIRYYVQNELNDGTTEDLMFRYESSEDFRQQLRNLYNSIVKVREIEEEILDLTELSSNIRPEKTGVFSFADYHQEITTTTKKNLNVKKERKYIKIK